MWSRVLSYLCLLVIVNAENPGCIANVTDVFCEKDADYPEAELNQILGLKPSDYMLAFGEDFVPEIVRTETIEAPLCVGFVRLIYPQKGKSANGAWHSIVNHEPYNQGIRIEECLHLDRACSATDDFPNHYVAKCEQEYAYRPLFAWKEKKITKVPFQIPVSCKCKFWQT
ncbi:unnamed protein product [Hermetia illucens]|uniref:Spaetzle domain-containing protein n=1 Tax=Hermetia illucens TaxID=343691 RepID=A0A7R8V1F2_HERIL|nr:protein spaetzle-like isoform X3 [Hermetia illucens]CAD7091070.1 unnamed protein product [Hermetia illucens]